MSAPDLTGLDLPSVIPPAGTYLSAVLHDGRLHTAGHIPLGADHRPRRGRPHRRGRPQPDADAALTYPAAMTDLATVAPAFVEMAHRIVWCTVATTAPDGRPRTRILHPIWEWDGAALTGWIATSPLSPKATDLAHQPAISLTYWDATHDTGTADCDTAWETSEEERRAGWDRFANGPAPVGYDPSIIPGWTDPTVPAFGILRLMPHHLRVMPGSVLLLGTGDVLAWRA